MANNFPSPKTVLVISAHPDDPEFSAGGTIARWTKEGASITYIIVTDGSKGTDDRDMTKEVLVPMREEEQKNAAKELGVKKVIFLGQTDGETQNNNALRELIVRQIRTYRPEIIITHDPTARISANSYPNHTDHRIVGDVVLDAIYPLARDRLNFTSHEKKGLHPHKVLDVFLTGTNHPNIWVDVSATMDSKIMALRAHVSQIGEADKMEARIREFGSMRAEKVSFEYAEIFRRIQLPN
ncbi:MAG: PIG-L family deacetylase [Chloroflexota bacterium]